jgi:hypothetical protein
MTTIEIETVAEPDGWTCSVRLTDDAGSSEHRVRVRGADLERYAPGSSDPADLVRRSFEFLLVREPRRSILNSFDLPVIGRYFLDYEATIRG